MTERHVDKKSPNTLLRTGLAGTLVTALCCFTPILVIALGTLGLSVAVPYLDVVLLPALAVFVGITIYAWVKRPREACCAVDKSLRDGNEREGKS